MTNTNYFFVIKIITELCPPNIENFDNQIMTETKW